MSEIEQVTFDTELYLPEMRYEPQLTFAVHASNAVRLAEKKR